MPKKIEPGRLIYETIEPDADPRKFGQWGTWDVLTAWEKAVWAKIEEICRSALSPRSLSIRERRAIQHAKEYLRDVEGEADLDLDEQIIASAPLLPPDGGSPGCITIRDLKALIEAAERLNIFQEA